MTFHAAVIKELVSIKSLIERFSEEAITFDEIENADRPFISCSILADDPQNTLDEGEAGIRKEQTNYQLQVAIYMASRADAVTVAKEIKRAFDRTKAFDCSKTGQRPDEDKQADLKGELVTFSCWHSEDVSA